MKSHTSALFVLLLLVGAAGVVGWRALTEDGSAVVDGPGDASAAVAVEVAAVDSGLLREVRVLSGTLEASTRFDVAAKVGGLIEKILVDIGDEVERGQTVAVLDDDEFVQLAAQATAELAVREAELAQAKSELERVTHDFNRLEGLFERGVASDLEFSEISAELASQEAAIALAEARVRQARATLELESIRLGYTSIRASWQTGPQRGAVGMRYEDAGDTIQAGDPIVAIVGLDPLKAVVSVTEGDYARLEVGQKATLTTDARPGQTFDAAVARIAPVFRESSRQARVEFTVENPQRVLRPGMFIRLRVVLREAHAETIVPAAAMVKRGGRNVVFTIDEATRTAREHAVEVGIVRDDRVQIIHPSLTGSVVVLGQHLLEDGSSVTITE